ncbi:hypothetical protein VTL71DRAFT_13445 [Oculimacula yallundae]|uniref:Enoyl reductase (ER) domain-containing protein n=1 Tax=Oculimacula yallundae TaxID=86028 RepID=A0ABR4CKH1_9HELO
MAALALTNPPKNPPVNTAAWLPSAGSLLSVGPAPSPTPSSSQIVIHTSAVAINPVDHMIVTQHPLLYSWLTYPTILGYDVSGTVVSIGSTVSRFKIGDRVVGLAYGAEKLRNKAAESAFQEYVLLNTHMVSRIPDEMTFEDAVVMPLALSTAAVGLFQDDQLALRKPSLSSAPKAQDPESSSTQEKTKETVIIWGGSTSVGCNAIQLAVLAGYTVLTTCSPSNFEYVRRLGAAQAFDYRSSTVVSDMVLALEARTCVGALITGKGGAEACLSIFSSLPKTLHGSQHKKFLSMAAYPSLSPQPNTLVIPRSILYFITWSTKFFIRANLSGVKYKFIWGGTLVDNGLGKWLFEQFLGPALEEEAIVTSPKSEVVGIGLDKIQRAFESLRGGVSAKKLVVKL